MSGLMRPLAAQANVRFRPKADIRSPLHAPLVTRCSLYGTEAYRALSASARARLRDPYVLPPIGRSKSWPQPSLAQMSLNPSL